MRREPEDASFDWFKSYADVADIIRELIPSKNARILMLGCGNSTLSEDVRCPSVSSKVLNRAGLQMYEDGYKHIINVDVRNG